MTTHPTSQAAILPALLRLPGFVGLAAAVFFLGFGVSLSGPFIALYGVNHIGMSPLQLGIFLTLNAVSSVILSTRLARWSDRLTDRRPLVLLALGVAAAGQAGLGVVRAYPAAVAVGIVLVGLGAAAFPQLFAYARTQMSAAPGDIAERGQTVLRSMFSLAFVVGPGLGAAALARFDFMGVFLLAAVCLLLAAVPILLSRSVPLRATPAGHTVTEPRTAAPNRPVWLVSLAFVLYGMSMTMAMSMFPLFITKTLHGTTGQVGFLVSLCALLEIPVMLGLVMLRRLPSVEWLVKGAMGLFVLHYVLIYVAHGMPLLIVTQVVRSVVLAILAGLGMTYFQQLLPGRVSAATTLFSNTMNVGGMLAGIVSGAIAQAFGFRDIYLVCAMLTFSAWAVMQVITRPGFPWRSAR
ncbi:SET family sugar efflux transporter-like MFS transporter [Deinococcus metalli]|uniref:Sugar efflux transporter n=1 Tax=Deinococcus metalli TaxID=1141878 RepID=A0A7W8KCM4_9DEIO|nr:sugar efflux transporter [Deinococcus metalli]MBB5375268.1 SET family sugar efflux transporter-like MFS transporter [Deinococcus metalli]GHF30513.1 putative sugar efflux transporter [Deinococcus metalli]